MDLSKVSNEELMRAAGLTQSAKPDLSSMSDAELMKIAGIQSQQPLTGNDAGPMASGLYGMSEMLPGVNKASNFIGAGLAKGYDKLTGQNLTQGQSLIDLAKQAQADTAATQQSSPNAALAGNALGLVGSMGFGSPLAKYAAAGAIPNAAGRGMQALNSLSKPVIGSLEGGALGALYGAGNAPIGDELQGAGSGAQVGAMLGGAIPAVAAGGKGLKTIAAGVMSRNPEELASAATSLFDKASKTYQKMRAVGAELNPQSTMGLVDDIDKAVNANKFIPQLNPKTSAIVDHIKMAAEKGNLGVDEIDQYRKLLKRVGNSEDGVSAGAVRRSIDDYLNRLGGGDFSKGGEKAVDLLNQARGDYQKAAKFDSVAEIIKGAEGNPSKIKSGLNKFLKNEDNTLGWTTEEKNSLKQAAKYSLPEGVFMGASKLAPDLTASGITRSTLLGGLNSLAFSPAVAVTGALSGLAAKGASKGLASGKAENLLRLLEH